MIVSNCYMNNNRDSILIITGGGAVQGRGVRRPERKQESHALEGSVQIGPRHCGTQHNTYTRNMFCNSPQGCKATLPKATQNTAARHIDMAG